MGPQREGPGAVAGRRPAVQLLSRLPFTWRARGREAIAGLPLPA